MEGADADAHKEGAAFPPDWQGSFTGTDGLAQATASGASATHASPLTDGVRVRHGWVGISLQWGDVVRLVQRHGSG